MSQHIESIWRYRQRRTAEQTSTDRFAEKNANKKRKRIKEKWSKIQLFILYNLHDFDDMLCDKGRKRIKEKWVKLCSSSLIVYS